MPDLSPKYAQARVESLLFHSGAPTVNGVNLGQTSSSAFAIRSDTFRSYYFPLAARGAVDLGITLHHNLTAAGVGVSLAGSLYTTVDLSSIGGSIKYGQKVWGDTFPPDARFAFVSERSVGGDDSDPSRKVIEVSELRQPVHKFLLTITPSAVPDAGELYFNAIWRY